MVQKAHFLDVALFLLDQQQNSLCRKADHTHQPFELWSFHNSKLKTRTQAQKQSRINGALCNTQEEHKKQNHLVDTPEKLPKVMTLIMTLQDHYKWTEVSYLCGNSGHPSVAPVEDLTGTSSFWASCRLNKRGVCCSQYMPLIKQVV